jgi:hypothetical protein
MRSWGRTAETWLNGLETWQFVLLWDGVFVVVAPLGTLLGESLRGRPADLSVLLGSALGTLVAASVMAFRCG